MSRILLVGDWFVDDHWVVGTYRSSTSSRTGKKHLAALQDFHSTTESLCGAGRTASVLSGAGFPILGVGICAKSDETVLMSLLGSPGLSERNPHTLRRWTSAEKPESAEFFNLGDSESGTSRAIRIYERAGAVTVLTQRLDWETPVPDALDLDGLARWVEGWKDEIGAVVIKDLAKQLVRPPLIRLLARSLGDRPWFISTKSWQPEWFRDLEDVDVRLLIVPEIAARAALGTRLDDDPDVRRTLASWMVTANEPSKGALAVSESRLLTVGRAGGPRKVVVVPDDRTVLAVDEQGRAAVHRREARGEAVPMAMSSVLLGSLTARLIEDPDEDPLEIVRGAAGYTYRWRDFETRRVTEYWSWNPSAEPKDDLGNSPAEGSDAFAFDWREAHDRWKDAYTPVKNGIIHDSKGPRLELWRAMTELPDYVCIVRKKREAVAGLAEMLRAFARSDRSKQESCLLEAPPGAGKTWLVRCLARSAGFQVLAFNVTHLYRREDLLDCFDRISTTQAQFRDTPLLIFFDEINAPLGGESVYGSFLTPLEEGVYVRAEKSFRINPAVWLFAGTGLNMADPKASDFQSRLTRGRISLTVPASDPEGDYAELERVYLGASLLKRAFQDIEVISEDVLDLFRRLPSDLSIRRLSELARNFENIRHRRVVSRNIPWKWIEVNVELQHGDVRSLRERWKNSWANRRGGPRQIRVIARPRHRE